MELPKTPIPIIENTHIEFNKIILYKGEICEAKKIIFLADIKNIEASKIRNNDEACTKIFLSDEYFKVKEKYKKVKETWLIWLKWTNDLENEKKTIGDN